MWKHFKRYIPVALLASFFMLGDAGADLLQPLLLEKIVDGGILGNQGAGNLSYVITIGGLMALVAIMGGVAGSLCNLCTQIASQKTGNLIRQECFQKIMGLPIAQVDELGAATLITRLTNDISQIQGLLSMFMRMMVRMSLFVVGSISLLFSLDPRFGIVALIACPIMALIVAACLRMSNPLFERLQTRIDIINAIMQEDIDGFKTIKAFVREAHEKQRFGKANDDLAKTQLSTLLIFALMSPSVSAVAYIAIACMLAVGNHDVMAGSIEPGAVMAALSYALLLLQGTMMIVLLSQGISRGLVSWKRVRELLELEPSQIDGTATEGVNTNGATAAANAAAATASAAATANATAAAASTNPPAAIEFKDVFFSYPTSRRPVLKDINLTIHAGETVAIMGATGCGKTALASLIPRFHDANEGTVLVDGLDVRSWKGEALRAKVAFAFQKAELFNASVHENIAWGAPDASREDVEQAARIAQADEFIQKMERTYDETISERGANLSGGQRQRIALSRIALSPAGIIVLDDATSALDIKTEANFHAALAQAKPEATIVIVAQRIATALLADRIVVMERGRIVGTGTHEQLIENCPIYQDIYHSQIDAQVETEGVTNLG